MQGFAFGLALRSAYLNLHRQANRLLAPLDGTADQFVLLSVLATRGPLTQRDLGQAASADPNTITAMLRVLERRELVRRVPHETDQRARVVTLTELGRERQRLGDDARGDVRREELLPVPAVDGKALGGELAERTLGVRHSLHPRDIER